jgi:hypothetical protein
MLVGYDSPEAFEEVLWRTFFPDKYGTATIALWGPSDAREDARAFFIDHMRKVIVLRTGARAGARYLSKNNANIARLDLLDRMFPGCQVLVPMRRPVAHVSSLLRQHRHFTRMHQTDPFSQRYMADLGHYEFGHLHRPLAFPGFATLADGLDPSRANYWLAYYVAAFEYVAARRDTCLFVSYEQACANPTRALATVCDRLDIPDDGALEGAAALFRPETPRPGDTGDDDALDPALLSRANAVYQAVTGDQGPSAPG